MNPDIAKCSLGDRIASYPFLENHWSLHMTYSLKDSESIKTVSFLPNHSAPHQQFLFLLVLGSYKEGGHTGCCWVHAHGPGTQKADGEEGSRQGEGFLWRGLAFRAEADPSRLGLRVVGRRREKGKMRAGSFALCLKHCEVYPLLKNKKTAMKPTLRYLLLPFPEARHSFSQGLSSCSVVSVLWLQSVFLGNKEKREHCYSLNKPPRAPTLPLGGWINK